MESSSSASSFSLEPREYAKTVDPEAIRGRAIDKRIIEKEVRSATIIVWADPVKTRSAQAQTKAPAPATRRPITSFLFDLFFRGVKSAWIPFWAGGFRTHIRSSGLQQDRRRQKLHCESSILLTGLVLRAEYYARNALTRSLGHSD